MLGSREIVRALEHRAPDPPLLPADGARARARVEEAEHWGDQVLQPLARRIVWRALAAGPAAQLSYLEDATVVPGRRAPSPAPSRRRWSRVAAGSTAPTDPAVRPT